MITTSITTKSGFIHSEIWSSTVNSSSIKTCDDVAVSRALSLSFSILTALLMCYLKAALVTYSHKAKIDFGLCKRK